MKDLLFLKSITLKVVGRALLYTAKACGIFTLKIVVRLLQQIQCLVLGIWELIILFFRSITLKVGRKSVLELDIHIENNCTTSPANSKSSPWEPIILF
ncbi:hypothetical protein ES332_D11G344600v1 [Gossypium tomentosum]|uniref:Uncharacterized protein n=1 Tax=Gossypium tomentosum TaxID=34277 RepID=A0A5D2IVY6_GOSTO|nr:hypothetical protein ES332_D11G344600v1 [Gossypium tomentosum]